MQLPIRIMRRVAGRGWTGGGHHAAFVLLALITLIIATGCGGAMFAGGTNGDRAKAAVHGVSSGMGERAEATVGASRETGEDRATRPTEAVGDTASPFGTDQRAEGGKRRAANLILAARFGEHEGYERVVLDLGMGDQPAHTPPEWTLEHPAGEGVLRVFLPSVGETRVSNGHLGESLLKSFYVVRAPEEGMFVDIFARGDFRYRLLELSDPARIVVDFQPTGDPLKAPLPARIGNTVVVEPQRGSNIGDPFTVSGYSRNHEATTTVILTSQDGSVKARKTVQGNDWTSTWGCFETTIDPPAFEGGVILKVGATNVRDGNFDGVEIPVKRSHG